MEIILLTGGIAMTDEDTAYRIWVDWERHAVSLKPVAGYEMICFFSRINSCFFLSLNKRINNI